MYKKFFIIKLFFVLCLCFGILFQTAFSQSAILASPIRVESVESNGSAKRNRWRGKEMLKQIKKGIKERYYDENYHGIDLDARFEKAEEEIEKAEYNGQIFNIIAGLVLEFNDSHTKFFPPNRANRPLYGFISQMIGADCFVMRVDKGSDAERKGLKVGEIITSFGPYKPTINNLNTIKYILYQLNPQESLTLNVLDENNKERTIELKTEFKSMDTRRKENFKRGTVDEDVFKCAEIDSKLAACKLYSFSINSSEIDKMMNFASKYENFIFDLRGNSGGYVHIEEYLVGHFFDRKVKIGDFVTRKKTEERIAKPIENNSFKGNLIVLIDSHSASAAEVFARTMQIEKRGKIIGDVSAGAVMTSNILQMQTRYGTPGNEVITPYALNLTIGDLIMSDGKRLENAGVIPDVVVGPNGKALSEKRDPVLSYAAHLLGVEIDGIQAGKKGFMEEKSEEGFFDKDDN